MTPGLSESRALLGFRVSLTIVEFAVSVIADSCFDSGMLPGSVS